MFIEFDTDKRTKTLTERGLDFARAGDVFADKHLTREDARENYGEARRIISMRKANEREIKEIGLALG